MADKIKCGILGVDHSHALDVLKVLQAHPDFDLVGVAEPDAEIRAAFKDKVGGTPWVEAEALLANPAVKMVAVESYVPRLVDLGMQVVQAGKHLHLDKPGGGELTAFERLLQEAEQRELIVQMGYMFRYNSGFDLIRRGYQEGWFGDIYAISAAMCTDLPEAKRNRMAFHPGGVLFDLGSHLIDMIVLLLGPPLKVTPYIRHDGNFDDAFTDNNLAVLEYPHAQVTVHVAAMEPQAFGTRHFKVAGAQGSALMTPLEPPALRLALRNDVEGYKAGVHQVELPDLPRHQRDFEDLARCIRGEKIFGYTKQHDLVVQKTLLQASGMQV